MFSESPALIPLKSLKVLLLISNGQLLQSDGNPVLCCEDELNNCLLINHLSECERHDPGRHLVSALWLRHKTIILNYFGCCLNPCPQMLQFFLPFSKDFSNVWSTLHCVFSETWYGRVGYSTLSIDLGITPLTHISTAHASDISLLSITQFLFQFSFPFPESYHLTLLMTTQSSLIPYEKIARSLNPQPDSQITKFNSWQWRSGLRFESSHFNPILCLCDCFPTKFI